MADSEVIREAAPDDNRLELAVARARVAKALFGDAAPIKVGRYSLIEKVGAGGMGVVWQAWDPELGRAVALKLASSGSEAARTRARDEGRALAKLAHPNVVPIYDVLDVEQGVFLVMELVKGESLRSVKGVAALVRAYRQAGEGLAAAHAAGLVHRDFKPDNAILGADGRVRVLDFGLASSLESSHDVAGTPRYMAPEQRDGKPLTPAVDQYALCVALRESLGDDVPRWLAPIVARGTAEDPAARYPSMTALLRELANDPAARWRRRALVIGAVLATGGIGTAFAVGRASRDDACAGGPALIAWPAPRVAEHLGGLNTPFALDATPRILRALDDYAKGWVRVHRASCELHRRDELSSDLYDRRTGCLARRRSALATAGELASTVTAEGLPRLAQAVAELPDLAACEDDAALIASVPPPPRPQAAEAAAIADLVARVDVERDAGRYEEATRDADAAVARARAVGYRPLIARALLARGRIDLATAKDDRGAARFADATREALASGDEPTAVEAFARNAWAVGTTSDPINAADGLPLVEAILERLGDRARFQRALLHLNLGAIANARGDRDAARAVLEQAREEAALVDGSGAVELTAVLTGLLQVTDDPVRRAQIGKDLIDVRTARLGPLHPQTLMARVQVATLLDDLAAARTELWLACRTLAEHHPSFGSYTTQCASEVMWLSVIAGDTTTVRAAVTLATAEGSEPMLVAAARAYEQLVDGDFARAARALAAIRQTEIPQRAWWHEIFFGDLACGEAVAHHRAGDRDGARRAIAIAELHYTKIGDAVPAPIRSRRAAVLQTLKGLR